MDPAQARALLAEHRRRIEMTLSGLGHADAGDISELHTHLADAAELLFEDERDAGLADGLRRRLVAIDRAEARLAAGTYGLSVESGAAIPDARLEVFPWAERTVAEQSRLEAAG